MIKYLSSICLFIICSSALSTVPTCKDKKVSIDELIQKIEAKKNAPQNKGGLNNFESIQIQLAKANMIGSVQNTLNVCVPYTPKPTDVWHLPSNTKDTFVGIIFWDGNITNMDRLNTALSLMEQELSKAPPKYDKFYDLYLAWMYEKKGLVDKAIPLYEKTLKGSSPYISKSDCELSPCPEIFATIESLNFLARIYYGKHDDKKVKEIRKEIDKYEKLKESRKFKWELSN